MLSKLPVLCCSIEGIVILIVDMKKIEKNSVFTCNVIPNNVFLMYEVSCCWLSVWLFMIYSDMYCSVAEVMFRMN